MENSYHPKQPIEVGPELQIEHIMPQSIDGSVAWQRMLGGDWQKMHALYCNNIGNLTLTGYNPELSSKSFEEKLNEKEHGFLASSFGLNSYVKKQTEWSSLQIEEGARLLSERAVEIWRYPSVDRAAVEVLKPKKGKASDINWTTEEHHRWLAEGGPCHALFVSLTEAIEEAYPSW